jgi:hypothetical protein
VLVVLTPTLQILDGRAVDMAPYRCSILPNHVDNMAMEVERSMESMVYNDEQSLNLERFRQLIMPTTKLQNNFNRCMTLSEDLRYQSNMGKSNSTLTIAKCKLNWQQTENLW